MFKQYLLNSIVKEMKLCRRLATKIPADKMNYKSKEDTRSIAELLHYLSYIGTGIIRFWYRTDNSDLKTFFAGLKTETVITTPEEFIAAMDKQIELATSLFDKITEEDLHSKMVAYPWGETAPLGEAIIETSIKWMTAYKLQLFSLIKHSTDQKMGTPDAWRLTELTV
jgi:hypothetical protein